MAIKQKNKLPTKTPLNPLPGFKLIHALRGHDDGVRALSWTPDGEYLISASSDRTVRAWDFQTGKEILRFTGHKGWVNSLAVSGDGKHIISASSDKTLIMWDLHSGKGLHPFVGHSGDIWTVAVSPDGHQIVSGCHDRTIRIWDLDKGVLLKVFEGHEKTVLSVVFSPDGKKIVSGSDDHTIKIWDLETGKIQANLEGHTDSVRAVQVTRDGRQIISASMDGSIRVWDSEDARQLERLEGHKKAVGAISLSHSEEFLASASFDHTVIIWLRQAQHPLEVIPVDIRKFPVGLAFHPSSPILATVGEGGNVIHIWDVDFGFLLGALPKGEPNTKLPSEPGSREQAKEEIVTASFSIAMKSLSDNPIEKAEDDVLQYQKYANTLVDFVRLKTTTTPLTIAIDAPWGQGKSSIMNLMIEKLPHYGLIPIRFNAWRYDNAEILWAALAQTVLDDVKKRWNFRKRINFNLRLILKRFDRDKIEQAGTSFVVKLMVSVVLLITVFLLTKFVFSPRATFLKNYWPTAVASVPLFGVIIRELWKQFRSVIKPFTLKLSRYLVDPKYQDRVGFLDLFRKDFETIIGLIKELEGKWQSKKKNLPPKFELGDPGRIVIFVDDLDRCSPPRPVDIIEAINVILDFEHCIFILGMDTEMICASIETKYKSLLDYLRERTDGLDPRLGQRFMEKIVQVNFRIPTPGATRVNTYFESLTERSDDRVADRRPAADQTQKPPKPVQKPALQKELDNQVKKLMDELPFEGGDVGQLHKIASEYKQKNPEIEQKAVDEWIRHAATEQFSAESPAVREAIKKVVDTMEANPRKIKRFINIFRLKAAIAETFGAFNEVITPGRLAQWIFLSMDWPELVKITRDQPAILSHLIRTSKSLTKAKKPRGIGNYFEKIAALKKDRDLMRFLKTWDNDFNTKTIKAFKWM